MQARLLLSTVGLLVLSAVPALAVKTSLPMTPQNLQEQGFSVRTEREENGAVEFYITRDPAKARWQGRYALLHVQGDAGPVVRCQLEPDKRRKMLTYRFSIAPEHVRNTRFTVAEVQSDPNSELELIGGGTFYEFRLADFMGVPAKEAV